MHHETKFPKLLLAIGLLATGITICAWQSVPKGKPQTSPSNSQQRDTTKPSKHGTDKNEYRIEGIDEALLELDEQMLKFNEEMKKMDFSKMKKDLAAAQKEIGKIDLAKMEREINESMRKVDWKKMQVDVEKAMQEANIQMKEVDFEKMNESMKDMQIKLEKQQLKLNLNAEKMERQIERGLEHARKGMVRAKEELQNLRDFTNELEKDGLISKKKGFNVKVEDGQLFINGNKQPNETYEKYKQYYKKDKFSIKSDGENTTSI